MGCLLSGASLRWCLVTVVRLAWILVVHVVAGVVAGLVAALVSEPRSAWYFLYGLLVIEVALSVAFATWVVPVSCRYLRSTLLWQKDPDVVPTAGDGVCWFVVPAVVLATAGGLVGPVGALATVALGGVALVATVAILVTGGRHVAEDWIVLVAMVTGRELE